MKKVTTRELKWINKGYIKKLSYNKFEAKGKNSFFYCVSDENFTLSFSSNPKAKNYSFIISISDKTFYSLNFNENISIVTSINGYKTETFIDKDFIKNPDKFNIKIERNSNCFNLFIDEKFLSSATLPAAMDAISFDYLFNNKEFIEINDFLYIKK